MLDPSGEHFHQTAGRDHEFLVFALDLEIRGGVSESIDMHAAAHRHRLNVQLVPRTALVRQGARGQPRKMVRNSHRPLVACISCGG